jgi:hypothetical protein
LEVGGDWEKVVCRPSPVVVSKSLEQLTTEHNISGFESSYNLALGKRVRPVEVAGLVDQPTTVHKIKGFNLLTDQHKRKG